MFVMRLLVILFVCVTVAGAQEQQEAPTFRTGVTDVRVDVEVVNGKQRIQGLKQADFAVFDEEQPQAIAYFGQESVPLDLLLLLDISGSVQKHLRAVAEIAQSALKTLEPQDRVAVMAFSRDTKMEQELTSDASLIAKAIEDASREKPLGGGTKINEAVIAGAEFLRKANGTAAGGMPKRRAILVITDNVGVSYQVTNEMAVRALYEAGAVLNAIAVGRNPHPPALKAGVTINPDFAIADVFHLAEQTGGEAVAESKPAEKLGEMLSHIRNRYTLAYRAPGGEPGQFRRIRVQLSDTARRKYSRAAVHARSGYYVSREH